VMNTAMVEFDIEGECAVDPVDEIRLRTWARQNYTPAEDRDETWHPIILDEMLKKDLEGE
jgi:hypothetical protein